jgi:hypothetical protein
MAFPAYTFPAQPLIKWLITPQFEKKEAHFFYYVEDKKDAIKTLFLW